MAKKKMKYVIFRNEDGSFVDDEPVFHIIDGDDDTLCDAAIYYADDKFYATQPKTYKGKKLTFCEKCKEEKKAKKSPAKKKK